MSVSDKPWLADRQPSLRGGVLQVTTGLRTAPAAHGKREASGPEQASAAMQETVEWRQHGRSLLSARRHIDLQRVSSALCRR